MAGSEIEARGLVSSGDEGGRSSRSSGAERTNVRLVHDQGRKSLARAFTVIALSFPTLVYLFLLTWLPDVDWKRVFALAGCLICAATVVRIWYNARGHVGAFRTISLSWTERRDHKAASTLPYGFGHRLDIYYRANVFFLVASLGFNGHQLLLSKLEDQIVIGMVIAEKFVFMVMMTIFVYNPAVRKYFPPRLLILQAASELTMAAQLKLQAEPHFDGPWLYLLGELTFHYRYHKVLLLLIMVSAVWYCPLKDDATPSSRSPTKSAPSRGDNLLDGEKLLLDSNRFLLIFGVACTLVVVCGYLGVVMAGNTTQSPTAIYFHTFMRLIQACLIAVLIYHVTSARHEDQHNLTTMESTFILLTATASLISSVRSSSFENDTLPRAHAVEGISLATSTLLLAMLLHKFTSGMRAEMRDYTEDKDGKKVRKTIFNGLYSTVLLAAVGFAFAFSVSDGIEQLLNGNKHDVEMFGTDNPLSHLYSVVYSIGNCLDSLSFLILLSEYSLLRAQVTALLPAPAAVDDDVETGIGDDT